MKAIGFTEYGPSTIKLLSLPKPEITDKNSVIIKVKSASINPVDWKLAQGYLKLLVHPTLPKILGMDYSGTIVSVGSSVVNLKPGDQVYGKIGMPDKNGTIAEFVKLDYGKDSILLKPAGLSHDQACTIGICGVTAFECLINNIGLDPLDLSRNKAKKVLVIGCSGGVGIFAIQLLKKLCVQEVWGVCSSRNEEFMKQNFQVDRIVDYTSGSLDVLFKDQVNYFDAVMDCVGGEEYWKLANHEPGIVKSSGMFITIVGGQEGKPPNVFDFLSLGVGCVSKKIFGRIQFRLLLGLLSDDSMKRLDSFIKATGLIPYVGKIFPLDDGITAFEESKGHRSRGKIVLKIEE